MEIAFTIPAWLLWILGIIIGIIVLASAIIGIAFLWSFRNGPY